MSFQSYEANLLNFDTQIKMHKVEYKIVDTDFEETWIGLTGELTTGFINAYEKRGLNVAANLVKMFKWHIHIYGGSLTLLINLCKRNPMYTKYADELEKYLPLM